MDSKGKENSGIENITPPSGITPASGMGGSLFFGGTAGSTGLQFQKSSQELQQQQKPQQMQTPLTFSFSPVVPSSTAPSMFGMFFFFYLHIPY